MPFSAADSDLLRTLVPLTAAQRLTYSHGRKPWTPGYRARAYVRTDTGKLAGFDAYAIGDTDHVELLRGTGTAADSTGKAYDVTGLTLPTDTDITDCEDYLNAVLMVYPSLERRGEAVVIERLAKDASLSGVTRPYWQVIDANTFKVGYAYASGPLYSDVPAGWVIEVIVPTAADIDVLVAGSTVAGNMSIVTVKDFMAAGVAGTDDGVITLDRVFN